MTLSSNSVFSASLKDCPWHPLAPFWQGTVGEAKQYFSQTQLSSAWRNLLLEDTSPTHHLHLLTQENIEVDVIDMTHIGLHNDRAPKSISMISNPRLRRQVWLQTTSGQRLVYATSWWNENQINQYLQNPSLPIWNNLSYLHMGLCRDIQAIYLGESPVLEREFQEKGPFWGRHYLFLYDNLPLTLIYEVFSPYLKKFLND